VCVLNIQFMSAHAGPHLPNSRVHPEPNPTQLLEFEWPKKRFPLDKGREKRNKQTNKQTKCSEQKRRHAVVIARPADDKKKRGKGRTKSRKPALKRY
jgi:hypothetical protein